MPGTIVQPSGHGGADDDADCKCGDEIFAKENQKWCRHKFCTGEGEEVEDKGTWSGEMEGGKRTGAECSGRALNLKKTCNRKCNFYKEDEDRNFDGLLRVYVPCNASHVTITECVQEDKMRAFQTHIGNSSFLLLDLEKILISCTNRRGLQGFKCSGVNLNWDCLIMIYWCTPYPTVTCNELQGTTATGKTIDPQLCSNQSFWDQRKCNYDYHRCTGATPGQCGSTPNTIHACKDGSSDIKPTQDGDCGKDLMCRARDGKWAGENICLKKKFLCDNYIQCEDGKDEEHCEGEYLRKRIFPRDYHYVCRSASLIIKNEENKTGKFFPLKAIRFIPVFLLFISLNLNIIPLLTTASIQ